MDINTLLGLIKTPQVIVVIIIPAIILLTELIKNLSERLSRVAPFVALFFSLLLVIPYAIYMANESILTGIYLSLAVWLSSCGAFSIQADIKNKLKGES